MHDRDWAALAAQIKDWGKELGFDALGIAGTDLGGAEQGLAAWLVAGFHGEMDYMAAHGAKRARPAELVPGTQAIIAARMNYLPAAATTEQAVGRCPDAPISGASQPHEAQRGTAAPPAATEGDSAATHDITPPQAEISRYAQGRDYHKVLRNRLQKLADRIATEIGAFGYRVFTDSAPVMEVELAAKAGLGWRGKHTLLLSREAGSWFFLGEILVDLPLPPDAPAAEHCGTCRACLDACPTGAIVAPYQVDARRCVSYLTIELKGSIPEELRAPIGNRLYGCDDCQLCCPWNRHAPRTREEDFAARNGLDRATLLELFAWTEADFEAKLAGSAIRRIGYERWLRNLAIGLGNAPTTPEIIAALEARRDHPSALVREHVEWALARHQGPVVTGREGSAHHSLQEPG